MSTLSCPSPDPSFVIQTLQHYLETGSRWAEVGNHPQTGLSCYGLVRFAFHLIGVTLPASPRDADRLFVPVEPPYQAWDMVCTNTSGRLAGPRHVGLLLAPTWGFHCSEATNGLARFDLLAHPWKRLIRYGWRLRIYACG